MPEWLLVLITAVAIPFVIQILKKIKLPTKVAPIVAVVLATLVVAVAKHGGMELDVQTVYAFILKVVGIAGASVIGYDQVKALMGKPA